MGGGVATEDFAEEGHENLEVSEIGGAPGSKVGLSEVEDEKFAAGFEDAEHFGEAGTEVG